MAFSQFGTNAARRRKRVYYEGTDVIKEGMPVAYNFNTTDNILGFNTLTNLKSGTTGEGGQNEGKFQRVELCTVANAKYFAGVVAGGSYAGLTGPMWLDIYEANSSIVPVWTDKSITIEDEAYLEAGQQTVINSVAATSLPRIGTFMETVDRSSTAGICLCKVDAVQLGAEIQKTGAFVVTGAAPASAAGDLAIPITHGGITYWVNATDAAPAGP